MKPWLILIVVAVAALIAASAALPLLGDNSTGRPPQIAAPVEVSQDAPEVVVDGDLVYPFGVMAHMTERKHTWTIRNKGKGPLKLINEGTTCQCTMLQLPKDAAQEIPPGGSLAIDLSWTPKVTGNFKQTATIGTNDPRQPKIVLSAEGKVYPAVVVVPADQVVSFGTVGNEEDAVRPVLIYSKDRPDTKITRVTVVSNRPNQIAASVRRATPEETKGETETGHIVEVTLKAGDKLGPITGEVLIATDHPEKSEVKVRVSGNVTGPISFIPARAEVRNATSSDGGSAINQVWVRGQHDTHFTVASTPAGVSVEFEPMPRRPGANGSMQRMTTRIAPGTPAGDIRGEIVLRTDHPHAAEIRLPVDAFVQGKN